MNEERIKEVFSDELFVKQLLEQEDAEQVQALLIEKDIDLSIEDICKIQELLIKQLNGEMNLEELSDEDLEDVTGGFALSLTALVVAGVVATACALATGAALGVTISYLGHGVTRGRW